MRKERKVNAGQFNLNREVNNSDSSQRIIRLGNVLKLLFKPRKLNLDYRLFFKTIHRLFIYCIILLFITILILLVFRIKDIRIITNIKTNDSSLTDKILNSYFQKVSFREKNVLFYDKEKLIQSLDEYYPDIRQIDGVNRNLLNTIVIKIKQQDVGITWQSRGAVFQVDINGYIVSNNNINNKNVNVIDQANLEVKVGDRVVTQDFITFVNDINNSFQNSHLTVDNFSVPISVQELNVGFKNNDKSVVVKFNTERNYQRQFELLERTLAYSKANNTNINEYIDLRVDGKVFYK